MGGNELPTTPQTPAGFAVPGLEELRSQFAALEIVELIGSGGMGAVFKARQSALDRLVALKILPPEVFAKDAEFAGRFVREARALARLSHPHIVAIYDFGQTVDGLYYLVMEYVDGPNLRHLMHRGDLTPERALAIVPQVCDALQYAHDEGVVHRDIKPENLLLDGRGQVKIADFGLAKLLAAGPDDATLTQAGRVMGTWHYMAPEQLQQPEAVDHRVDIYSLGVVFYEMLTGQLPLGRFEPPSQRANIDARLDDIVLRSLEQQPQRRFQRASEVKLAIEAFRPLALSDSAQPVSVGMSQDPTRFGDATEDPLGGVRISLWAKATLVFFLGWVALLLLWNFGLAGLIAGLLSTAAGPVWLLGQLWRQSGPLHQECKRRRRAFIFRGVQCVGMLWATYLCFGAVLFLTLRHGEALGLPDLHLLASTARRAPEEFLQPAMPIAGQGDVTLRTSFESSEPLFRVGLGISHRGISITAQPPALTLIWLIIGIGTAIQAGAHAAGLSGTLTSPKKRTWRRYYRPSLIAATPTLCAFPLACLALWIFNLGLVVLLNPRLLQQPLLFSGQIEFSLSANSDEFNETLDHWLRNEGYDVLQRVHLEIVEGDPAAGEVIGDALFLTVEPNDWGKRWHLTFLGLRPVQPMFAIVAVSSRDERKTTVEATLSNNILPTPATDQAVRSLFWRSDIENRQ